MRKIYMFLTLLVASVFLGALPTFSSSGPFGTSGPPDYADIGKGVDSHCIVTAVGGTGPYGAFGFLSTERGVVSKRDVTPGGSGPYGAFASYGMIPSIGAKSGEYKDGCVLVAKNCLPNR
jgi:hypothetical protein